MIANAATKITKVTKIALVFFGFFGAALHAQAPRRIVSLVPNVTEMLFAVGAGPQVIGVSSFDEEPPEVRTLARVGGLLDPDTERILALKPDLVVVYGSQEDLKTQLTRANIPLFDYRHGGLADVLSTLRAIGARTGHAAEAVRVAAAVEQRLAAVRARVAERRRPRTLLVFGREPGTLRNIWASGGVGFLHDMLVAAGGDNVFADVARESVQATTETILARAPDVVLELRSEGDIGDSRLQHEIRSWAPLASVPAVKNGHVIILTGKELTVPGPRVAESIERMSRALHPD